MVSFRGCVGRQSGVWEVGGGHFGHYKVGEVFQQPDVSARVCKMARVTPPSIICTVQQKIERYSLGYIRDRNDAYP